MTEELECLKEFDRVQGMLEDLKKNYESKKEERQNCLDKIFDLEATIGSLKRENYELKKENESLSERENYYRSCYYQSVESNYELLEKLLESNKDYNNVLEKLNNCSLKDKLKFVFTNNL